MSSVDLVASTVLDGAAVLLNDPIKQNYTYAATLPYLRLALQELREHFELNNIPVTQNSSAVITMAVGQTAIVFNGVGIPTLPTDFVEPQQLWESPTGQSQYIPMTKVDYLPHYLENVSQNQFVYYTWNSQQIQVLPALGIIDIKIDYVLELFGNFVDQNSAINVINAATFLEYRTAALCAEFIERNKISSDALNIYAMLGIDRATGIGVKGKQNIFTRRRPFRSGYKRRG
jgi:hypothetical protein